jgi:ABC-type lipoprotein export system ATPase subunit
VAEAGESLVTIDGVVKDYRALRPLRVQHLEVRANEIVALLGFDQGAAEVLVNLIAGATLPDSGEVRAFGRPTTAITDGETWLKALDEFGIVSERAVLLEQLTTEQNLAVPLSLDLDGLPEDVRGQVRALARETGIDESDLARFASSLSPLTRMRLRLARAIAIAPKLVMAEHPNASLPAADVPEFAADLRRVAAARQLGLLVLTADERFATSIGTRVLKLTGATGTLTEVRTGWRSWFGHGGG